MSNMLPQIHPSFGHFHWRSVVAVVALLLVAATLSVYLDTPGDDTPAAPAVQSAAAGGPDETLRGQAAGSAAGAEPVLRAGGANEASRGQAAASAAGGSSAAAGGPDEAARGLAASGAAR